MFNFSKKKDAKYLYLIPISEGTAKWEIIDEPELEKRVAQNLLNDGSRLFKLDQEISIRFEKITHLE